MARTSMADLIAEVRAMTAAPADLWPDDRLQACLDQTRRVYRYAPLEPSPTYTDADTLYYAYSAGDSGWENDYEITDGVHDPVQDEGSSPLLGLFSFPESVDPPLRISGSTYDLQEAAAILCEQWATALALEFDFDADSGSFQRSQKGTALRAAAKEFRARVKPGVGSMVRGDE